MVAMIGRIDGRTDGRRRRRYMTMQNPPGEPDGNKLVSGVCTCAIVICLFWIGEQGWEKRREGKEGKGKRRRMKGNREEMGDEMQRRCKGSKEAKGERRVKRTTQFVGLRRLVLGGGTVGNEGGGCRRG